MPTGSCGFQLNSSTSAWSPLIFRCANLMCSRDLAMLCCTMCTSLCNALMREMPKTQPQDSSNELGTAHESCLSMLVIKVLCHLTSRICGACRLHSRMWWQLHGTLTSLGLVITLLQKAHPCNYKSCLVASQPSVGGVLSQN